jgi:flagellar biosynthetic protein FliR
MLTESMLFQYALVFTRVSSACSFFPGIGEPYFPTRAKLIIALFVSILIHPLVYEFLPSYSGIVWKDMSALIIEAIIGIIISIATKMYFLGIHVVGQIASMQSGLGAASFFDPNQHEQLALFSNFIILYVIAMIFATDTHHLMIHAISDSYSRFAPGEMMLIGDMSEFITKIVSDAFVIAFKMSSPFLIISLVMSVGSGILARLMPNLQVFFVMAPIQILVILGILYIVIKSIAFQIIESITGTLGAISTF